MKRREPLKEWNEWLRSFCFAGWFACFGLSFSSRSAMAQCAHNPPQESKTKPTFTNRPHSLALPSRLDRPPPFNKNQRFLINGRAPSAPQSKTIQSIHSQRIDWWDWLNWLSGGHSFSSIICFHWINWFQQAFIKWSIQANKGFEPMNTVIISF